MWDVLTIIIVGFERFSGLSLFWQFNLLEEKILVLQVVVEAFTENVTSLFFQRVKVMLFKFLLGAILYFC